MKTHFLNPAHCLPLLAASLLMTAQAEPPVKVYILAGQSNMQGKGSVEGKESNSLRHMVENDPKMEFQFLVNDDGEWVKREDVWIHYGDSNYGGLEPGYGTQSSQIGPELGFGHVVGDAQEGQVLLIKAAWGGKSLGHDFLPPSVGKYPEPLEPGNPGYYYHEVLRIASNVTENIDSLFPDYKGQGFEIAGFGWHQGWNDQYGGLDAKYEDNMVAFIKDIRSVEHGLGVPGLPFVIATSGNIGGESVIKQSQLAMADTKKYPEFAGNVAVVDTDQPYGPDKMIFKYNKDGKPADKVGYHWDSNSRAYLNIGRAMAMEMEKLKQPKSPSRLVAHGSDQGVVLNWQLGTEKPKGVEILRNGERLAVLAPTQTEYLDTTALPGANSYELVLNLPSSGKQKLSATSDTSVAELNAYRGLDGVVLTWKAKGNYEGFRIARGSKVIAENVAGDSRSFEDKQSPERGEVTYAIVPTTGKVTPATLVVNIGSADPGGALVYEPFDYPASFDEPQLLSGKGGALGTKGSYVYDSDKTLERTAAVLAKGLSYGELPVTGNRGSTHRWSAGTYIELDDSLKKAGLLEDGATLWMSYVFAAGEEVFPGQVYGQRAGGGAVTLRSEDMKEGVGFNANNRQYETAVVLDGEVKTVRIASSRGTNPVLVVGRITWGKDGEKDTFVPFLTGLDLKMPEKEGRHAKPFQIDQSKISRLVLSGEGQFDEIRVGPTFESVIGAGGK